MVDVDDASAPSGASMLAKLEEREGRNPLEESPHLRTFFACWLETFLLKGKVDPALRERAVLRVMWRCNQPFEWANHYRLARDIGLSDDEILAVRTSAPARDLSGGLYLVAGYRMFATVSASSGRRYDGPPWPPDGVGPSH